MNNHNGGVDNTPFIIIYLEDNLACHIIIMYNNNNNNY